MATKGKVLVTGGAGFIGSHAAEIFAKDGHPVVVLDNLSRAKLLKKDDRNARFNWEYLGALPGITLREGDVRDAATVREAALGAQVIVHAAAQTAVTTSVSDPRQDFENNVIGAFNVAEAARLASPKPAVIFCSTNKVYGDTPNRLPLVELETRLELPEGHRYHQGIDTSMSIDSSTHSLFGVSKAAADLLVQEYGHYFGMPTVCFRGGCLTGPHHAGAQLHGFLAYLMKCTVTGTPYTVFGYGGKQVRDNIHSADLVACFMEFQRAPRSAAVYNIGGGRFSNCSMIEAIEACERISGRELDHSLSDEARIGDHRWWISDLAQFRADYPDWEPRYGIEEILGEIHSENVERWAEAA